MVRLLIAMCLAVILPRLKYVIFSTIQGWLCGSDSGNMCINAWKDNIKLDLRGMSYEIGGIGEGLRCAVSIDITGVGPSDSTVR